MDGRTSVKEGEVQGHSDEQMILRRRMKRRKSEKET